MADEHSSLPYMLSLVADALGIEAVLELSREMGGEECSIPAVAEGSNLAERVGLDVAQILCENFSGQVYIPKWKDPDWVARRRIIQNNPNASANALVRMTGLSVRQVRRIRGEMQSEQPDDTPNFFDALLDK